MAYSVTNPPVMLINTGGSTPSHWAYKSSDLSSVVDGSNYFSNGEALGMKQYDIVTVIRTSTSAAARKLTAHTVTAISSSGAATISSWAG